MTARLIARIRNLPEMFWAFRCDRNDPTDLIEELSKINLADGLSSDELYNIAKVKSHRKLAYIKKNDDASVRKITQRALALASSDDPWRSVDELKKLKGVGIGVATAVLSWTRPQLWGVLDKHSWRTLCAYGLADYTAGRPFGKKDVRHWVTISRSLAASCGRNPQQIDRWLFAYSITFLGPLDDERRQEAVE